MNLRGAGLSGLGCAVVVNFFADSLFGLLHGTVLHLGACHCQMTAAAQRFQNHLDIERPHAAGRDVHPAVFGHRHKAGIHTVDGQ